MVRRHLRLNAYPARQTATSRHVDTDIIKAGEDDAETPLMNWTVRDSA